MIPGWPGGTWWPRSANCSRRPASCWPARTSPPSWKPTGDRNGWRRAWRIAARDTSFLELLTRRGLGLRTDLLRPLSNWQTADFALRRFDTRYFAAVQPMGQETSLLEGKGSWGQWRSAAAEIAARDTTALGDEIGLPDTVGLTLGELTVPPVELMLEKLASARGCIAYLASPPAGCGVPARAGAARRTDTGWPCSSAAPPKAPPSADADRSRQHHPFRHHQYKRRRRRSPRRGAAPSSSAVAKAASGSAGAAAARPE